MKTLRTSSYLIDVKLDDTDKHMLIHGYTGAIDVVNEKVALALKNNPESFQQEDCSFSDETTTALEKRGYLTARTQEEEYAYVARMAEALHRKDKILNAGFTFLITYDCNFRCPYCYEAGIAQDKIRQKVFTKEMVDKAYNAIMEIQPQEKLRSQTIALYGGEPLLKENKEITQYIIAKGKELNFKFHAITNGYDLDSYEDLLSPNLISHLQITIDGMKNLHNTRRVHFAGYETFDKIVANIGLALKKDVSIVVRVNTDRNNFDDLLQLKRLFDELHYTENDKFSIDSALLRNYDETNDSKKNLAFLTQKEFVEKHKELKFEYGCHDYGALRNLHSAIVNHKPLQFRSTFCAAQTNSNVLDPFGKIYPCWDVVGKPTFQLGEYQNEHIKWNDSVLNKWRNHNISTSSQCKQCKYALLCGGGCLSLLIESPQYCTNYGTIVNYAANKAFQKANINNN